MRHESANLDLLRTIAVALVVLCHIVLDRGRSLAQDVLHFGAIGRVGVAIFFVHTSLVLLQSMARRDDGAAAFYVRRAFRIFPLSVAMVLISAGAMALGGAPIGAGQLASNLLLVQNITGHGSMPSQLWTLPYEVQMYLVLPVLLALASRPGAARTVAMLWLAAVMLAASGFFPLLLYVPCFLGGVLAHALRGRPKGLAPWMLFALVVAGTVVVSMLQAAGWREERLLWVLCAVLGVVIPHTREMQCAWLERVGAAGARYSYSIYLTHLFAIAVAFALQGFFLLQLAVMFGILAGLSLLTDRLIEQPGIRLGKRLAERIGRTKKRPQSVRTEGAM
jgi:peptidoglycan/LPS O-acetylase OafA/YrhL